MSVELKEFKENGKTFLAVGYVEYKEYLDYPYHAVQANGAESWFNDYNKALNWIAQGLNRPKLWTTGD